MTWSISARAADLVQPRFGRIASIDKQVLLPCHCEHTPQKHRVLLMVRGQAVVAYARAGHKCLRHLQPTQIVQRQLTQKRVQVDIEIPANAYQYVMGRETMKLLAHQDRIRDHAQIRKPGLLKATRQEHPRGGRINKHDVAILNLSFGTLAILLSTPLHLHALKKMTPPSLPSHDHRRQQLVAPMDFFTTPRRTFMNRVNRGQQRKLASQIVHPTITSPTQMLDKRCKRLISLNTP